MSKEFVAVMRDTTENGVEYEMKAGGPWDSETVAVLYRTPDITDEQIEGAKDELRRYNDDTYGFEVVEETA
jgi:hypothetical protein